MLQNVIGIPGIDMQFPSADKIKEQQDAKQKQLQTARQSGFKLPSRQIGSNVSRFVLRFL